MPKLNNLQLAERIRQRIAQLKADEEIAAKDVRALLTDAQHEQLETAWQHQQQLRKGKRATTEAQQKALGWKSKQELRVEAFKQALHELEKNSLATLKDLQHQNQVRQSRIYLDTYFAERVSGASKHQAESRANNALTRAGLARLDGADVDRESLRDQQVHKMEERLRNQLGLDGDGKKGEKE
jgi:hypothetical protein